MTWMMQSVRQSVAVAAFAVCAAYAPQSHAIVYDIKGTLDGLLTTEGVPFSFHGSSFELVIVADPNQLIGPSVTPPTPGGSPRISTVRLDQTQAYLYLTALPNHIGPYALGDNGVVQALFENLSGSFNLNMISLCPAGASAYDCSNQRYFTLYGTAFSPENLTSAHGPTLYPDDSSMPWSIAATYLGHDVGGQGFVGEFTFLDFQGTSFSVVNAIPEPSTYALTALGLGIVVIAARRRRRS